MKKGKMIFYKYVTLYCLILTGCVASNSAVHIQTYPIHIPESEIGNFDVFFRRYSFNRFWFEIDYDLKQDLMLYKDSVRICYKGKINDVVLFKRDDNNNAEMKLIKLTRNGTLIFRFYPEHSDFFRVMQGDTVMLYTKNALFTSSDVFPLDSIRFIQGERYKFKDNFVKKKGKPEYGYYTISL